MNLRFIRILFPHRKIFFYINPLDTVISNNIKIPHRLVVFRRISRRNDDKAIRYPVISECFVLQELQHRRSQRLGYTVDFIEKQDSLMNSALFDLIIDRGDNFTHCILCDRYILPIIGFLRDKRQSDRTLSRMMCDRIRNQIDSALLRHLFHNCGLTDSRRPDQKYRTLSFHRNRILPGLIFCQVRLNRIYDFLFCLFDVHKISPLSILLYPLTNIISLPSPALLSALPKKFSAVCHPRKKQIPSDNPSVFSDILHTRP